MIEFKRMKLSDRSLLEQYFKAVGERNNEYCFTAIYTWQESFNTCFAVINDCLVLKTGNENVSYSFPVHINGDESAVMLAMKAMKEQNGEIKINIYNDKVKEMAERLFPENCMNIQEKRDSAEYLYNVDDLVNLAGRKYHSKRNHIANFNKSFDWTYEQINNENINDCIEMNKIWCAENNCETDKSANREKCALDKCFEEYFELKMTGGLLKISGKIAAFTIGEPLYPGADTFVVHFEKALSEYKGAYAVINQQFAINGIAKSEYLYINREDDAGVEGLRKAKLSYNPAMLVNKYRIVV